MMTDDRLATLIRAGIEEDMRGLALPAGFAQRIVAGPARRRPRWRVHFAVAGAVAATAGAVMLTAAVLPDPAQPLQQPSAQGSISPAAFDPAPLLKFGNPPTGWNVVVDEAHPAGGLREVTDQGDRTRQVRRWQVTYVPRRASPEKARGEFLKIDVLTGKATLASVRAAVTSSGPGRMSPLRVPRGSAEYENYSPDAVGTRVIWAPRPGMVLVVQTNTLARDTLFAVVRGITIAKQ